MHRKWGENYPGFHTAQTTCGLIYLSVTATIEKIDQFQFLYEQL